MNLTEQQQAVVSHFRQGGSAAVSAVAGSGKTSTLVSAMSATSGTLLVAFNKRNADELAAKLPQHHCKTLNALGHAAYIRHTGLRPKVDGRKLWQLFPDVPRAEAFSDSAKDIVALAKLAKVYGLSPGVRGLARPNRTLWLDFAGEHNIDVETEDSPLFDIAERLLVLSCESAFKGLIDFDDQIYMPVLFSSPFLRYQSVAVDEAQDLSELQHEMVARSLTDGGQLTVVGDPHQALYAFRGASTSSFDDLRERFSLPHLPLTKSFRCPRSVVREAQRYVPEIEAAGATEGTVESSPALPTLSTSFAVLSRTNAPLVSLALKAIREHVPVSYLGRDFMQGLQTLLRKAPTPAALREWREGALASAHTATAKLRVEDRFEALAVLQSSGNAATAIKTMLEERKSGSALTLSTIHKAKGLEWDSVVYLDYGKVWRGPQESNAKYVGVTRAKHKLLLQQENPHGY